MWLSWLNQGFRVKIKSPVKSTFTVLISALILLPQAHSSMKLDFEKEKKRLESRKLDFYGYVRKKKRDRAKVDEFAEEHSRTRIEHQRKLDQIRKDFITNRKVKLSDTEAEKKYLELQNLRRLEYDKKREKYAKFKKQLLNIRSMHAVPDKQAVGLEKIDTE